MDTILDSDIQTAYCFFLHLKCKYRYFLNRRHFIFFFHLSIIETGDDIQMACLDLNTRSGYVFIEFVIETHSRHKKSEIWDEHGHKWRKSFILRLIYVLITFLQHYNSIWWKTEFKIVLMSFDNEIMIKTKIKSTTKRIVDILPHLNVDLDLIEM